MRVWFRIKLNSLFTGVDGTGVQIDNLVDVSQMNNQEVAMRISTDVDSGEEYFTDLNGFHAIRRKRLAKIPLQANYYPVPSMIYLQDEERSVDVSYCKMTVHVGVV